MKMAKRVEARKKWEKRQEEMTKHVTASNGNNNNSDFIILLVMYLKQQLNNHMLLIMKNIWGKRRLQKNMKRRITSLKLVTLQCQI